MSDNRKLSASELAAEDFKVLVRARNTVIAVQTSEEARVERAIADTNASIGYATRIWDCAAGARGIAEEVRGRPENTDPADILGTITTAAQTGAPRQVWLLKDFTAWLPAPLGMTLQRQLKNLASTLASTVPENAQVVVILGSGDLPGELVGLFPILTWPRPDRSEIARILDETLTALPENLRGSAVPNGGRAAAIDAVIGLTGAEIGNALAASIIKCRRIDPELVGAERKRLLAGVKGLSAIEPVRGGFDAVGGLGGLKAWAREQSLAFGSVARAAGIAPPRGILLVGPPGTGKTLLAKALAGDWQSILLKLDMGGLRSKFLGESETGLRRALSVIEAFGEKCIVLLDEIEKAIAGAGKGAGDGGVADDALGTLLSWQQDRPAGAFLVATCNSVTALPPELLRAGRFDAVFFVDLPSALERAEIVATALRAHNRDGSGIDLEAVAAATPEYSGAELAALVPAAMLRAFADSTRAVVTDDLLAAAKTIVPLAVTAARQTAELREWAKGKTRPASAPLTPSGSPAAGRTLDL